MLVDGEEYTFYLVQIIEPYKEIKVADADLEKVKRQVALIPQECPIAVMPCELHARFNGGHLVWSLINGKWEWD